MIKIKKEIKHFLRVFFLIFLFHSPDLFSQDFEVTSVAIVGGNSFCPETSPKNLIITLTNKGLATESIADGQIFRIFVNGTNKVAAFNVTLKTNISYTSGQVSNLIYPTAFDVSEKYTVFNRVIN